MYGHMCIQYIPLNRVMFFSKPAKLLLFLRCSIIKLPSLQTHTGMQASCPKETNSVVISGGCSLCTCASSAQTQLAELYTAL